MPPLIDLDHNATTAIAPEVADLIARESIESYGNPGSRHALGRAARRKLEDSRELIATLIGAFPDEVIFTSGGTEANNQAIFSLAKGPPGTLLTSPGEHPACQAACDQLLLRGWKVTRLPVDHTGRVLVPSLPLSTETRLVSLLWAHNETGVVQELNPWQQLAQSHPFLWHLDAVQAVGKWPVNFHATGATSLAFGAHKFHGPRGIGVLCMRRGVTPLPMLHGGHQEMGFRAGTEPVPLIVGMARALELAVTCLAERTAIMEQRRNQLEAALLASCQPAIVHAQDAPRLPNTLNIAFIGVPGEALLVKLDLAGVCCSLGSACASGSSEPSPILVAMGCPVDVTSSSLRMSVGIDNTPEEITLAAHLIAIAVKELRQSEAPLLTVAP